MHGNLSWLDHKSVKVASRFSKKKIRASEETLQKTLLFTKLVILLIATLSPTITSNFILLHLYFKGIILHSYI